MDGLTHTKQLLNLLCIVYIIVAAGCQHSELAGPHICPLEHVSGEIIDDLVATDSMLLQFLINCPYFF